MVTMSGLLSTRAHSSLPPSNENPPKDDQLHSLRDGTQRGHDDAPWKRKWTQRVRLAFSEHGSLRPFRLLRQDIHNLRRRYLSDWTYFNQLILASAVFVFFTNLLPGITFASDLYELTGKNYGSIEVIFSTGLCGVIFSLWVCSSLGSRRSRNDRFRAPHRGGISEMMRPPLMHHLEGIDSPPNLLRSWV